MEVALGQVEFLIGGKCRGSFEPKRDKGCEGAWVVNEEGKGREALAGGVREAGKDLDGRCVGRGDSLSRALSWDRADGVNESLEGGFVGCEETIHRLHPRFFATKGGHVGEALKGLGN
jgi:hypothetical protein